MYVRSVTIRRITGIIVAVLLLAGAALPLSAQGDLPPTAREAALDAAEAVLDERATGWTFSLLSPTTDSSLGCPLVEGEEMAQEVTPYRVELLYEDGRYVVFVSTDGRMVQLCDSKFGDAVTDTAAQTRCMATATQAAGAFVAPDARLTGVFSMTAGTRYQVIGQSADEAWLQITSEDNIVGWVEAQFVTPGENCDSIPVTAYRLPEVDSTCYVTPLGAFANIRANPTTDAAQVARIYENTIFNVQAVNTGQTWYYIQPGWVSNQVVEPVGVCDAVPVNESLVGAGFASDSGLPDDLDQSVSRAQAQFPCPPNFEGYLSPRLAVGASAQVEPGGVPNTLRSFPSVDDAVGERLGTIQPGRTIDRVLAGPVCNQGFVWWLVEFDGATGWTAESNVANNEYYLTLAGTPTPQPADTATTAATPTVDVDAAGGFQQPTAEPTAIVSDEGIQLVERLTPGIDETADETMNPVTQITITTDETGAFIAVNASRDGEREGQVVIAALSDPPQISTGRLGDLDGIFDIAETTYNDTRALAVGLLDGRIIYYDIENQFVELGSLDDAVSLSGQAAGFAFSPDGSRVAVSRCVDSACLTSTLELLDAVTGDVIWSQTPDFHRVQSLAYTADGTRLVTGGLVVVSDGVDSGDVRVWDAETGTQQGRFTSEDMLPVNAIDINNNTGQIIFVNCAAQTGDRCTQGRIGLLEGETLALQGVLTAYEQAVTHVAYSQDYARFAVAAGSDIGIRNSATGTELAGITLPEGAVVTALDYSDERLTAGADTGEFFNYRVGELTP